MLLIAFEQAAFVYPALMPALVCFMSIQAGQRYKEESTQSHTMSKSLDEYTGMCIVN